MSGSVNTLQPTHKHSATAWLHEECEMKAFAMLALILGWCVSFVSVYPMKSYSVAVDNRASVVGNFDPNFELQATPHKLGRNRLPPDDSEEDSEQAENPNDDQLEDDRDDSGEEENQDYEDEDDRDDSGEDEDQDYEDEDDDDSVEEMTRKDGEDHGDERDTFDEEGAGDGADEEAEPKHKVTEVKKSPPQPPSALTMLLALVGKMLKVVKSGDPAQILMTCVPIAAKVTEMLPARYKIEFKYLLVKLLQFVQILRAQKFGIMKRPKPRLEHRSG